MVIPALNDLREIRAAIINQTHPDINLETITARYPGDLITGFEIDPCCLPAYREDNQDLTLSWGVSDYEILVDELSVKRLSNTELLITANYKLDCEVDAFVRHYDASTHGFEELGFHV